MGNLGILRPSLRYMGGLGIVAIGVGMFFRGFGLPGGLLVFVLLAKPNFFAGILVIQSGHGINTKRNPD